MFNTLQANRPQAEIPDTDKELARIMNRYWVNFAKTGNPNGEGLPEWSPYNTVTEDVLDIEPIGKAVTKSDPRKARLDVIEKGHASRKAILQTRGI